MKRLFILVMILGLLIGCGKESDQPDSVAGAESEKISFPTFPNFPASPFPSVVSQTPSTGTTPTTSTGGTTDQCSYAGRYNGDRATWYCPKNKSQYPSRITIIIQGCITKTISNIGSRYDSGGLIVKQSEVSGRGMAIVIYASCKSKSAYVRY